MKVIYVAGPYRAETKAGIGQNIKRAREAAMYLWQRGWAVICPHLNSCHMDGIASDQTFLQGDLEILKRCDAIYMIQNWWKSEGTRNEHQFALDHGLDVFYQVTTEPEGGRYGEQKESHRSGGSQEISPSTG